MERVAIIRPPESSLPLANSAGDRIGRRSHAICPLSTDQGEGRIHSILPL